MIENNVAVHVSMTRYSRDLYLPLNESHMESGALILFPLCNEGYKPPLIQNLKLCSFSQTANFKVSVDRICGTPLATQELKGVTVMTHGAAT